MERGAGLTGPSLAAAVLATAACAGTPPPTGFPPADLTARGNEPFWALRVEPDRLTLQRPDHPPVVTPNPGAQTSGGVARWTAETESARLSLTVTDRTCTDSMSGFAHPYTAEATVDGVRLTGCAAPTDALPREGG